MLHTIFHNELEHFSIAKIKVIETNEAYEEKEIVVKGYFSNFNRERAIISMACLNTILSLASNIIVVSYQTFIPATKDGLIAYLSSDLFYGIGKKTAQRIIDHLGDAAVVKNIK